MKLDTLTEYICDRALALYELLKQNRLIAIVGPIHTGKTTVLEILRRVLDRDDVQDSIGMKPMHVIPIYPDSTTEPIVFGGAFSDSSGSRYCYGQVHSAMWSLYNSVGSFKVLKFDGRLTSKLSLFLSHPLPYKIFLQKTCLSFWSSSQ